MDVFVVAQAMLRRWWVVVSVLALTAGSVFLVLAQVEPEYEARASILLAAPELAPQSATLGQEEGVVSAAIIAEVVQGDEVRDRLREQGADADYSVEVTGDGSILRVTARDANTGTTVPTVNAVLNAIDEAVDGGDQDNTGPIATQGSVSILTRPNEERGSTVVNAAGESHTVYEAVGSAALTGVADHSNPYAAAASGTLRVLQEVIDSPSARAAILETGVDASYTVEMEHRDAAPILYVASQGTDADGVLRTLSSVIAYLSQDLEERQETAGAPPSTWMQLQPLSMPNTATQLPADLRRPLLTMVGLGLVAAVSLALLVDHIIEHRRRSRRTGTAQSVNSRTLAFPTEHRYERVPKG